MDQELKQRLIGAAVITALAAIFVPMLFDDPIDETGKNISELKIPEVPEKVQDVEIMPLPEKVEEVTAGPEAAEKPGKNPAEFADEGAAEAEFEAPRSQPHVMPKETASAVKRLQAVVPDEEPAQHEADAAIAEAEDVAPIVKPSKLPVQQPQPVVTPVAPKVLKPAVKASDPVSADTEPAAKTAAGETGTRWYLNAGSFGQKSNALALQENLKQQGFAATVKEVAGEKGTVYKVRIGPMLDKAKAQAVKNKLTQINVNSFVSPDE